MLLVVLNDWVTLTKLTSCASNRSTMRVKSGSERLSRSILYSTTMSISPRSTSSSSRARAGRSIVPPEYPIVVGGWDDAPAFVRLAAYKRLRRFALGIKTVEPLLQPFLAAFAAIDRAAEPTRAHVPSRRPKKRGPFQRLPAMAKAAAERLL